MFFTTLTPLDRVEFDQAIDIYITSLQDCDSEALDSNPKGHASLPPSTHKATTRTKEQQ